MRIPRKALVALAAAPLLAACSPGGPDPETARLRARVEAQAAEIDSLGRRLQDMDARSRALAEQMAAAKPHGADAAVATPAKPAEGDAAAPAGGPEALTGAVAITAEAVGTYLDTEQGKLRIREAIAAEEKRREEEQRNQRREQMMAAVKERVAGSIAERLGLDAKQQQTLITIAAERMDRMEEIWRGARDGQGNPRGSLDLRQKMQEVAQDSQDKLQAALTADQYTKLQELDAEGNGLFGGRGFGGFGGPPGRGPGAAPAQGPGGAR